MNSVASATVITVNGDGTADYTTIQAAIDASSDGDEIIVAPGTYTSTGDRVVDMDGKEITLRSSDGAATTIIDGGGTQRIVYCNSGETNNTIIDGFTITNAGIGGLYCTSDATIMNCVFSNNYVNGNGAGMLSSGGNPVIDNCTFSNNTAEYDGGGLKLYGSLPTITNCSFLNNSAEYGGALVVSHCNPVLSNCSFVGNTASVYGGAVSISSGNSSPTMSNCTFASNVAPFGGGITVSGDCSISLVDCNFYTNSSTNETGSQWGGGAIMNLNAHINLTGCILDENTATYGGGICNHGGTATIIGCTFEENIATEGGGMINWHSAVVISDTLFDNNTATIDNFAVGGGGIANYTSEVAMTACTLHNNHASNGTGGAMFSQTSSGPMQMTNCTVTNNTAKHWGGGLYATYADMILTDHTSSGNTAVKGDGAGIHASSSSLIVYMGTSSTDEIFIRNFANYASSLSFNKDASCDVTGDVSAAGGGAINFDINLLDADGQLTVSGEFLRNGALGVTNLSGSLSDAYLGDIYPLAQATALTGSFSSVTLPAMPVGLGLQLIEQDAGRDGHSEVAVEVVAVEEASFANPFSDVLASAPVDIETFDADGDGSDEIVVLFEGAPGSVVCFSVSADGLPTLIDGFSSAVGNNPVDLDVADLNGDGYDDVVIANGTSNTISVFTTNVGEDNAMTFNSEVVYSMGENATCISVIDWDGANGLDVVVGVDKASSTAQDGYQVLLNVAGSGNNGSWIAIPNYFDNVEEVYYPDPPTCVDGGFADGSWGFVGGTTYGRTHRMKLSESLLELQEIGVPISTVEAVELGGDGQIDLMTTSKDSQMLYLFRGNVKGGFDDFVPIAAAEPIVDAVAFDADYDGDIDILICAPESENSVLTLLRNDSGASGAAFLPMGSAWSKQEAESDDSTEHVAKGTLGGKSEDDDWVTSAGKDEDDHGSYTSEDATGTMEFTRLIGDIATCEADFNADGNVNMEDLLILIEYWGEANESLDLNGDGIVKVHDLLILVAAWGACE